MPPVPGDFLTIDSGPLQARIHKATGHLELAGPDRGGAPQSTVITFMPATAAVSGNIVTIERVISSSAISGGLEILQQFGGGQVRTRLTFIFPFVMRYEVIDWNGQAPDQTSISAVSSGNEHFYGFGEKFNTLDQSGHVVGILTFDNPANKQDSSYKVAPCSSARAAMDSISIRPRAASLICAPPQPAGARLPIRSET